MSRTSPDTSLAAFGPRKLRTLMLLLFGLLLAACVALSQLLYGRRGASLVAGLAIFVLGVGLVALISGRITRPIVHLTRTAERLAGGDLKQRARVYGRDETGVLARTFNGMLDSLERTVRDLEARNRACESEADRLAAQMEKDAAERVRIERELRLARVEIDHLVDKRTAELARANDELHGQVLETRRSEDCLQNSVDRLERSLEGTFRAMSMTLELRDPYMAGHQHRVADLAVAIAQEINLPDEKLEGLRLAGIIHDIGKIATPSEIWAKPYRLSRNEFQLVKDHPRVGFEILKDIALPWPVAHIILQHHERLDGSGYPEGLAGDAILPEARILAVADVVEAVCSLRPYRPALGLEKGLEEIRKGRGLRYDTRAVDACIRLFREGRFSFRKETEAPIWQ
ncbi:MAG TPA: HD domain-containing protein [Candidatus Aminicenantes bacterium]|nr:HD domain-containing protein [Candidatus Aminicenantes bacterium]HRY64695.1 HD domain-containing protein [Candidatus Aminicenantes bacterium]HRZ71608.1 HD domain-containing protein [Candidatus Aminicenantes bacterium]